jgi:CCR4-NOT transcription complex subunit 1
MTILHPTSESGDDLPVSYLHKLLDRLVHRPPPSWNEENRHNLQFAVRSRFEKLGVELPAAISDILQLAEVMAGTNPLIKVLNEAGPRGTSSVDECKEMLAHIETRDATFQHVANALLFMVFSADVDDPTFSYDPSVFVAALRDHRAGKRLDWQDVVGAFDRPGLAVSKPQFLALYNSLLPLAQEYENFDIQLLWGGNWTNLDTQLSFIVAFLSCIPAELDASAIPRLRSTYQLELFEDASDDVRKHASEAVKYPFISLDAVKALFGMIFQSQEAYKQANFLGIPEAIINPHTELFVLAIGAVPQPWNTLQTQAFVQLFTPFLKKVLPTASFVMHGLWKRDHLWLIYRLLETYQSNPLDLEYIYQHAEEQGWIPTLTSITSEFGVDLAALAHKHGNFNLQEYLESSFRTLPTHFPTGLARILESKARNELNIQRKLEGATPAISLSLGTVAEFLDFLDPMVNEETHLQLLKICIQAFPRLINYGEGYDELLNSNCERGHNLSEEADQIMQEKFRKLYNNEIKVRDMIEDLQRYKQSDESSQQDIFASLINGLFDEYSCFSEYPVEALSHTAVLFGGVISYKLINRWALQLAMAMVLDAVHNSKSKEDKMYKFGLQALKQFQGRLQEWPQYCERLVRIDLLRSTDIWTIAEEVLQSKSGNDETAREADRSPRLMANGSSDFPESSLPAFTCIFPDPPLREELYELPSEDVQDKVLFVLNNVSPGNIEEKYADLKKVLEVKHHQWFAEYLVDQRAKLQANFQGLYLTLLDLVGDEVLWQEVLRETYVSIARLLNSDSTLSSATEKQHLKSLGTWLGSLTLARDEPIRLNNLSFKDLLIQAHATHRLPIAIPFTTKVIVEASRGELFQPPNPWTIDILRLLLELYHIGELRINLKFEIETLCTTLKFDMKHAEPASVIRESMQITVEDEFDDSLVIAEGIEPFPDMSLLTSRPRAHRGSFSPSSLTDNIPDIAPKLVYPPHSSNVVTNDQLRHIFSTAAHQAITEIIYPVVERSVTIAAIAAGQLVVKDFAMEPDENKFRNAAHQVVKHLSGCLAMVTCREPLRMSMSNHVRTIFRNYQDSIPEGVILMFVNDNLDIVCRVIEEAAEKHSIDEIESQIREAVSMRQVHSNGNADRAFNWPPSSTYSTIIPEPYKLSPPGLRPEQLAIYQNFGTSGSSHLLASGHEARQQLQDVLQDQFGGVSGVQSATDGAGSLAQPPQSLASAPVPAQINLPQLNGYPDQSTIQERAEAAYRQLVIEAQEVPEDRITAAAKNPHLQEAFDRVLNIVLHAGSQRDNVALWFANLVPQTLFHDCKRRVEVEIFVQLLNNLCQSSMNAARNIIIWLASLEDELLNPAILVSLVRVRLMEIQRADTVLAKALNANKQPAINCIAELVDYLLLSDHPLAIRSNLALSFEALVQWIQREPELEPGKAIVKKLNISESAVEPDSEDSATAVEITHVFQEWVQLHRPDVAEKLVASFIRQLHNRGLLQTQEKMTMFLKTCIDLAIEAGEQEHSALFELSPEQTYIHIDALAALVVALTIYQANQSEDGEVQLDRMHFFESILSIAILYQCEHYQRRAEQSNQKIFFRFYSSLMSEIHGSAMPDVEQADEMYLALARALLAMQPSYLPGFVFGWLGLVSHRIFLSAMMTMANEVVSQLRFQVSQSHLHLQAHDQYLELLQIAFDINGNLSSFVPELEESELLHASRELYRGTLRLMFVIFHDFPEFFIQNHFRLCNAISKECKQMRNVVLSAIPSNCPDFPYPFQQTVKLEAIDGMLMPPMIGNDFESILKESKLLGSLNSLLDSTELSPTNVSKFYQSLRASEPSNKKRVSFQSHQRALIHATVLYVCTHAIQRGGNQISSNNGPHISFLRLFAQAVDMQDRTHLVDSIINQLRYPNLHTLFFLHVMMDLFSLTSPASLNDVSGEVSPSDTLMELIVRSLLDRLTTTRPYPWGVLVALSELYKSPEYHFWELPFIKNSPDVSQDYHAIYKRYPR